MLHSCNCRHSYQSEVYGHNIRVHTQNNKGLKCTVCGNQVNNLEYANKKSAAKAK